MSEVTVLVVDDDPTMQRLVQLSLQVEGYAVDTPGNCLAGLASAQQEPADIEAGMAAGADDYVAKPFDPADLVRRVARLITAVP